MANTVDPTVANPTTPTTQPGTVNSTSVNMPTWLDQLNYQMGNNLSGLMSYYNNPSANWYQGPLVAGLTSGQTNAINSAIPGYSTQPYTDAAMQAMSGVPAMNQNAQAATVAGQQMQNNAMGALGQYQTQFDPNQVQQYMDPYTQSAVNAMYNQSNQNLMENILPGVNASFTGAGQFGSTRNGTMLDRAIRDTQQANANTAAGMYNNQFNNAMNQYQTWNQNPLTAANAWNQQATQAGNTANLWNQQGTALGNQANTISGLGTTAGNNFWNNLTQQYNMGANAQNNQQAALTAAYNQWQQQYQSPLQAIQALQPSVSGLSAAYRPNMIQTTTGLPTSTTDTFGGALGQLLPNMFPASGPNLGTPAATTTPPANNTPVYGGGA